MRIACGLALLALAGCGPGDQRYVGPVTTDQGACGLGFDDQGRAEATLLVRGDQARFLPTSGTQTLAGHVDAAGHVMAGSTLPGADRKPFVQVFEGEVKAGHVTGKFATPRLPCLGGDGAALGDPAAAATARPRCPPARQARLSQARASVASRFSSATMQSMPVACQRWIALWSAPSRRASRRQLNRCRPGQRADERPAADDAAQHQPVGGDQRDPCQRLVHARDPDCGRHRCHRPRRVGRSVGLERFGDELVAGLPQPGGRAPVRGQA